MAISIVGVRMKSFEVKTNDKGLPEADGYYEVLGSNGVVFATTRFANGYGQTPFVFSGMIQAQMVTLKKSMEDEINHSLGLN